MQENQLQFRVSSALKDLVGKDLITNDFIAIFELVKNSYDAYATKVDITFKKDEIVIADNGKGMTLQDIKSKWLFLGFSAKKDGSEDDDKQSSYRDKIKRHYAGAKGIGRFSCDRLGENLTLTTKSKSSVNSEIIYVNWTDFDIDQSKEFKDIQLRHISTNEKINFPKSKDSGTILKISSLHSQWNRKKILDLKAQLEKLINPFSETTDFEIELISEENKKEDEAKAKALPDGSIEPAVEKDIVNGVIKNSILDVLQLKTTQIALILKEDEILTTINDRGTKIFQIKEASSDFSHLQNVTIYLYYLNRAAKYNFSLRMGLQPVQYGSIFLFRNGFRIMPFGDVGDDSWGLDQRAQQGHSRFLGTRDLFGRVDVLTNKIDVLKEVSSRDGGLIKTEASDQLFNLFNKAHRHLERYVTGVLWGEAFLRKEYFENEAIALAKRKELLDAERDSESTGYILHSSVGSKIDFIQLIKTLANNKDVEILYYNKDLANIVSDSFLTDNIKPQFIEDLEKIAEKTNDDKLLFSIDEARRKIVELQKEKDLAEQKAFDEEQKRIVAEEKARKAEIARDLAEQERVKEEEAKKKAQLIAKEADLKRREEEVKRKEEEQKRKEEEEKRRKAEEEKEKAEKERDIEKNKNKYLISTRAITKETEDVLHTIKISSNEVLTASKKIKNIVDDNPKYSEIAIALGTINFHVERINKLSKLLTKADIEILKEKTRTDVASFIQEYLPNYQSTIKEITFENTISAKIIKKISLLDLSIIIDNLVSNAVKASAKRIHVKFSNNERIINVDFSDDGIGVDLKNMSTSSIFELGITDRADGSGIGLSTIKEIINKHMEGDIMFIGNGLFFKEGATFRLIFK